MRSRGGTNWFVHSNRPGANLRISGEDFFASSPTANLAGVNEGGHADLSEVVCSHSLFLYLQLT